MEFLKALFDTAENGTLTFEQLRDACKEKGIKPVDLSGGEYVPKKIFEQKEGSMGSTSNIQLEDFVAAACDADILIYNSTVDGGISSARDLILKNAVFADFKAVRQKKLYSTQKRFFQISSGIGDFMEDLNVIMTDSDKNLTFIDRVF